MGNFTVRFTSPGLTSVDSGTIAVAAAGTLGNPSLLPAAATQITPSLASYTARTIYSVGDVVVGTNPRNRTAGQYYKDSVSSRPIVRLTAPGSPHAGTQNYFDYWEGGLRISYPWGTGNAWYTLFVNAGGYKLVDFNINTYQITNWRNAPSGASELTQSLSMDPANPRRQFTWSGSTIRQWDISVFPAVEITGGGFPKAMGGGGYWVGMSGLNEWFVSADSSADTATIRWWDRVNNLTYTKSNTAYNEQKLDKSGRYTWINYNTGYQVWDPVTGTGSIVVLDDGTRTFYWGHAGAGRRWVCGNGNNGVPDGLWRCRMDGLNIPGTFAQSSTSVHASEINTNSHFLAQNNETATQWFYVGNSIIGGGQQGVIRTAVGWTRADASEVRFLAHTYNTGNTGSYYGQYPWNNCSPDGRLAAWVSNGYGNGRTDIEVAIMPN